MALFHPKIIFVLSNKLTKCKYMYFMILTQPELIGILAQKKCTFLLANPFPPNLSCYMATLDNFDRVLVADVNITPFFVFLQILFRKIDD